MLTDIQRQWVAALRSGEYKQGTKYLHYKDHFCCLGVLCDLAVKAGVVTRKRYDGELYEYDARTGVLPRAVMEWSGVQYDAGDFGQPGLSKCLAHENDTGATFEQIADIIESEPEDLFTKIS